MYYEMVKDRLTFLFLFLALAVAGALLVESYMYPGFIARFIFLPVTVWHLVTIGSMSLTLLIIWKKINFPVWWTVGSLVLTTIISFISTAFFYAEHIYFANYTLSTWHFHPSVFQAVAVWSWLVWAHMAWRVKPRSPWITWLFPLSTYLLLTNLRWSSPVIFELIGKEDHIIEWLTTSFWVGTAGVAGWTLYKNKNKRFGTVMELILATVMIGSIFVAGEEISWGQRIGNWETPSILQEKNIQKETTLHNISGIQDKMFWAYTAAGIAGSMGWILKKRSSNSTIQALIAFIPSWQISAYFYPLLLYSFVRIITGPVNFKTWEEFTELLMSLGVLLVLVRMDKKK
jgi:hypothetical protein